MKFSRDQFAVWAMQAIVGPVYVQKRRVPNPTAVAKFAYEIADAMIAEREGEGLLDDRA